MPVSSMPDSSPSTKTEPLKTVGIGILGLGTVGTGVYKLLQRQAGYAVRAVAVKNLEKSRDLPNLESVTITQDGLAVVNDPTVQIVVEVIGGIEDAKAWITEALKRKKHVITANKELIAKHGPKLFELARQNNVRILFEGAVAGGIPIIMPLKLSLAGNRIQQIAGIINGTTNYILTKMSQEGADYGDVLKQAQDLGFAEADPTSDVEGYDVAYKISILASLAFQRYVSADKIYREGITKITALDIQNARELGYVIKMIGLARQTEGEQQDVRVHPMLIPAAHPLASIHNENNAIFITGDAVGDVMFYGKGAGELPTASAVMGDLMAVGSELLKGNDPIPVMDVVLEGPVSILPIAETKSRYYIRVITKDVPGVIGHLGTACGECGLSLASVLQKGIHEDGTASIVLLTHEVKDSQVQAALKSFEKTVERIGCVLRVFS